MHVTNISQRQNFTKTQKPSVKSSHWQNMLGPESSNETVSMGDTAVILHAFFPTMSPRPVGGRGVFWNNSNPKSQVLIKFLFPGGGGFCGHHIPQIFEWGNSRNFEHKVFTAQARSCITDSLSHTTCVDTIESETEIRLTLQKNTISITHLHWLTNVTSRNYVYIIIKCFCSEIMIGYPEKH